VLNVRKTKEGAGRQ